MALALRAVAEPVRLRQPDVTSQTRDADWTALQRHSVRSLLVGRFSWRHGTSPFCKEKGTTPQPSQTASWLVVWWSVSRLPSTRSNVQLVSLQERNKHTLSLQHFGIYFDWSSSAAVSGVETDDDVCNFRQGEQRFKKILHLFFNSVKLKASYFCYLTWDQFEILLTRMCGKPLSLLSLEGTKMADEETRPLLAQNNQQLTLNFYFRHLLLLEKSCAAYTC